METHKLKVKKEAHVPGQWLIISNRDGFPRTVARVYDEEAADIFVAALLAYEPAIPPVLSDPIIMSAPPVRLNDTLKWPKAMKTSGPRKRVNLVLKRRKK